VDHLGPGPIAVSEKFTKRYRIYISAGLVL
jgi:hypothetical protein